jgi:sigma-B regulation protein RsbU (phosphoserine phosphatase)
MKKVKKASLGFKTVLGICIMVISLSLVVGIITMVVFDNAIDAEYEKNVTNLAETVGISIDIDKAITLKEDVLEIFKSVPNKVGTENSGTAEYDEYIKNYDEIHEDANFKELQHELNTIREANEVESIYIIYVDPEEKKSVYIVDGSEDPCNPGDFDPLYASNEHVLTDPAAGFPAYVTNTPEYGWLVSAGAPIYNSQGNVFAYSFVDMSMNAIKGTERNFGILLLVVTIIFAFAISIIYIFFIRNMLVAPINKLSKAALTYVGNESDTAFGDLDIHTGDEIENLADAMKRMEQDIKDYIYHLTAVTAEKERIGAELNVATQIQADMLPRIFPTFKDIKEYALFASMDPAKEVGGDFYDFFIIDDDHLGLVVADVSGKGVPAALFMVIAKTLIKNRALMGGSPSEVLSYTNEQLCENNEAELFVTVWFAIINVKTGKGVAANAGHEHPALRRAGGEFELVVYKHSVAVATMEGVRFREHEFELHHGDTLFCYTDGVTEATNKDNQLFGNDRLLAALNKDPDAAPEDICNNVKDSISEFVGEAPQFDDITTLCIKFN